MNLFSCAFIGAILWIQSSCLELAADSPLYLSPLIKKNMSQQALTLTQVDFNDGIKSYSGLITVDEAKNSNMFFWHFPAEINPEAAPLVIWLCGYVTPSTSGAFFQTGPYVIENGELRKMNISWNKYYNMLHIDNPVGVGYSFTDSNGYSKTLDEIAVNLLSFLKQFLKLFPDLIQNDLYLGGTSTAGKYVPAFAHGIYQNNKDTVDRINLKGIFVGNPYLDPSQIKYGEYLYQHGLVDFNEKFELDKKEKVLQKYLKEKNYDKFFEKAKEYIANNNSYVLNVTGLSNRFDYYGNIPSRTQYESFMRKSETKKALHVGNITFDKGDTVLKYFAQPYTASVKRYLEEILSDVKIMFFNGERDISWPYPTMAKVLASLKWKGADQYRSSRRNKIYNGNNVVGYIRSYGNLADLLVLNAGHGVITFQPEFVLQLFHNFTGYKL